MNTRHQPLYAYLLAALVMVGLSYGLPLLLPGDYIEAVYGSSQVVLDAEQEAQLRQELGGRKGFAAHLWGLVTLDWGHSLALQTPVSRLVLEALPWTLLLLGTAHLLALVLGFIAGVEAAWRRGGRLEKAGVGGATMLQGVPEIGSGVLLLLLFAYHLGWFPAGGATTAYAELSGGPWLLDVLHHLALPLLTLVLAYLPGNFLLTRAGMVMILGSPYLETARAKGLPPLRVRYVHAARNALLPVLTRFGLRLAFMITGALVVETIFAYPGLGTLLFTAIGSRDLPVIQAVVLLAALLMLLINLGLALLHRRLDPRIGHAL
ncbi:ABC transporter permease [Desulfurivibrio dismutans]|uniref:ABC transporter permease n=1 Tax=Desulfurivibrio dismutans TaxID=1398908 RepID=UPI0023DBD3A3|nr:ABC transporter permease [Desulfurivibrio alkaliphilus]MDF1615102.1 ABC transporter permease [Desulfurivibrio alkaliphilus]